jgi:CDP-diacylglycerol--glycerol-3-phosphate 3-phosphatidyltransferase
MILPTTQPARHSLGKAFNLPNQLTSLRLLLSVVLFGLIAAEYYIAAFVLFLIAVGTDWLDGYYARKFNQITTLGRILDPFADKVIMCGTFIFLINTKGMRADWLLLQPWMVVVIVGRELLVTALRSFLEQRGSDFSANMSGKLKMVLQCLAGGSALIYLHYPNPTIVEQSMQVAHWTAPPWIYWFTVVSIWSAVILTVYSGVIYVWIAYKLLKQAADAAEE